MRHWSRPIVLVAAILMLTACASDNGGTPLFGTDASGVTVITSGSGGETVTTDATGATITTDATAATTTTIPAGLDPLPLREGLGTFDNYVWRMAVATVGPTAGETSSNNFEWTFNREPESRISRTTTNATGPDIDGVESSTTEIYTLNGEVCQWDGEAWTHTVASDQQQEVLDVAQRLFDTVIVPESPVTIGSEAIAGIPATHYQYAVAGFGAESGALVTANQIDYWLADGTGVVVKYQMVIESRSGPTTDPAAEVYRFEASAELVSANVFVPVELNPDCLAIPPESA